MRYDGDRSGALDKDEIKLAKELAKESYIDITLSDEDLEQASGSGEPLTAAPGTGWRVASRTPCSRTGSQRRAGW